VIIRNFTTFISRYRYLSLIFILSFLTLPPKLYGNPTSEEQDNPQIYLEEKDERKIINLWPFIYYDKDKKKNAKEINLLGPFFTYKDNPDKREVGLSPFFYKIKDKAAEKEDTEFLYPLGKNKVRDGEKDFRITPLISSKKREDERFNFLLLYGGKTEKGENYGGVFPLAGNLKDRFGKDDAHFFLWPLYSRSTKGDVKKTNILWFIFEHEKGENQKGLQLWPFFGYREKEGIYRKNFYLWPFFFSEDTGLNTESPTKTRIFFPFYSSMKSKDRTSTTILWPFFSHTVDREKRYENHSFFPIFSKTKGDDRKGFRIFPIYGYKERKDYKKSFFLAPLYWSQEEDGADYKRTTKRFLFINKDQQKVWQEKNKSKREVHFWPLFNYKRKEDSSIKFSLPYLFPIRDEGIERNYPFLTLYRYEKDVDGSSSWDLLWKLMSREKSNQNSRFELAYIFDYYKNGLDNNLDLSLLKGLIKFRNNADRKSLHLFYLPWGFKWGSSSSNQE